MNKLREDVGIILVDHGSTREEANAMLSEVARMFREKAPSAIVEIAHMELCAPTIAEAFATCVERGARRVVIHPYFLAPGRHSTADIPRMAEEAAAAYPEVPCTVTQALGVDEKIGDVILRRVEEALEGEA